MKQRGCHGDIADCLTPSQRRAPPLLAWSVLIRLNQNRLKIQRLGNLSDSAMRSTSLPKILGLFLNILHIFAEHRRISILDPLVHPDPDNTHVHIVFLIPDSPGLPDREIFDFGL